LRAPARAANDFRARRADHDDGVAMLGIADAAIDIEVGYGLEDRVPDAVAARIIVEVMTPRLRAAPEAGSTPAAVVRRRRRARNLVSRSATASAR
jgi:uncharacterized protein